MNTPQNINVIKEAYAKRDDDFWAWRETAEKFSVAEILSALDFPSDPESIYYNIHTGHEETLIDLISWSLIGPVPDEDRPHRLAMELEHWLPKEGEINPVVARSLELSERKAMEQAAAHFKHYVDRAKSKAEFVADVKDMGGTLRDGRYANYGRNGKCRVELHDGREFVFPIGWVWDFYRSGEQPALF